MDGISLIFEDHAILGSLLEALDLAGKAFKEGKAVDGDFFQGAHEIAENFGTQCHNAKEERLIFPKIALHFPEKKPALSALEKEHEILDKTMEKATYAAQAGLFGECFAGYSNYHAILSTHINLENYLYNDCLKKISERELVHLYADVKALEIEKLGEAGRSAYIKLAASLAEKAWQF